MSIYIHRTGGGSHRNCSEDCFAFAKQRYDQSAKRTCLNLFSAVTCSRKLGFRAPWHGSVSCGVRGCVMVAKSFVMAVLATLLGPAVGLGLFVLIHNF